MAKLDTLTRYQALNSLESVGIFQLYKRILANSKKLGWSRGLELG